MRAEGRTALYDALIAGMDQLRDGSRATKGARGHQRRRRQREPRHARPGARARARSNAAIYTVGIFDDDDIDKNPGVLKSLARSTGGERFLPQSPGELLQACQRIAREIRERLHASATYRPIATVRFTASASKSRRPTADASTYGRGPATLPPARPSQP